VKDCGHVPEIGFAAKPSARRRPLPSVTTLHQFFNYDPKTGILTWKTMSSTKKPAGSIAGCVNGAGYRHLQLHGSMLLVHRIAFAMTHGRWPIECCDHINGNTLDNRACNLRECTKTQNTHNSRSHTKSRSGVKGVTWHSKRRHWYVRIMHNGRKRYFGAFKKLADAARVARSAQRELQGEFSRY
jgi:hypothetical protein